MRVWTVSTGPVRERPARRRRTGSPLAQTFDVLRELVLAAGRIVSKDRLIDIAWRGQAVGDSNLEKLIAQLRQRLAEVDAEPLIETVARRGYRLITPVAYDEARLTDEELDAMMAPHLALVDGRALIESLDRARIEQALVVFSALVGREPQNARCHAGLANACVWRFEATRADASPDLAALERAAKHAAEARRLDPQLAEAWAVFGFVLGRTGDPLKAVAALRHAVALEPGSWHHHLRLAHVGWGGERLSAAQRTLELWPRLPVAHLLAATVFVARGAGVLARRELDSGLSAMSASTSTFSGVALHLVDGLVCLAEHDIQEAQAAFRREIARESGGHLYATEASANAWYALGGLHLRVGDRGLAREAFGEAMARVPDHPQARAGVAILEGGTYLAPPASTRRTFEFELGCAALLSAAGNRAAAAHLVDEALAAAPPGNSGWTLPVDPLLAVYDSPDVWARPLDRLRTRAS